jgi:hypothetical protein
VGPLALHEFQELQQALAWQTQLYWARYLTLNFLSFQECDFKPASTIAANEPAAKVLLPETHVLSDGM